MPATDSALPTSEELASFLDSLHRARFKIGPDEIAGAQKILLLAHAEADGGLSARRLKTMLAPIVAKTPTQQSDFYRRFDALMACIGPVQTIAPDPQQARTGDQPVTAAGQNSRRRRRPALFATAAAALLLVGVVALWLLQPPPPPPPVRSAETPGPSIATVAVPVEQSQFTTATLSRLPGYQAARAALIALPLLGFAGWIAWRWRRRVLWLERNAGVEDADPAVLRLPETQQPLFPAAALTAIALDLRRHLRVPSRDLDIDRTIPETLDAGGSFTPVWQTLPRSPSYLFLIEKESAHDHVAGILDQAVGRLRNEDVEIERYHFHGDPRWVSGDDRSRGSEPIAEIAARHGDHRLVVLSGGEAFFEPLTDRLDAGVEQALTQWTPRAVLSTKPIETWSWRELALVDQGGFDLATASHSGLRSLAGRAAAEPDRPGEMLEGVVVSMPARSSLARREPQQASSETGFDFLADAAAIFRGSDVLGSGRLIAPGLVLTAGHVVDTGRREARGRSGWQVSLFRSPEASGSTENPRHGAELVWRGNGDVDLALLRIDARITPVMNPIFASHEQVGSTVNVFACGFPTTLSRDARDFILQGRLSVSAPPGSYVFSVPDMDRERVVGISGAAVCLLGPNRKLSVLGVVRELALDSSESGLVVTPIFRGFEDPEFRRVLGNAIGEEPSVAAVAIARRLRITGGVQGVGLRQWAMRTAADLELRGWIRNLEDGSVEALAIGPPASVEKFVDACRHGPPGARVAEMTVAEAEDDGSVGFGTRPTTDRAEMAPAAIFISYAREDQAAADRLYDFLREAGLDVWLDSRRLSASDDWSEETRRQIESCSFFIPLISANSLRRQDGLSPREWSQAAERARRLDPSASFIIPVVIDNTAADSEYIPDEFRSVQWTWLPDGVGDAAFRDRMLALVNQSRNQTPADRGGTSVTSQSVEPAGTRSSGMWFDSLLGRVQITLPGSPKDILQDKQPYGEMFSYRVEGKLRRLPEGHRIWLLNVDERSGEVWPQGFAPVVWDAQTGEWIGRVCGRPVETIRIVAVVAPPTSADFFNYYQELCDRGVVKPLKRIPPECTNQASIQVTLR